MPNEQMLSQAFRSPEYFMRMCRATTFHRIGTAHAFLNGLVKGFWKLVGREAKVKLTEGDDIRLTDEQKATIATNMKSLRGTSSYSSALANILQCAVASPRVVSVEHDDHPLTVLLPCVCLIGSMCTCTALTQRLGADAAGTGTGRMRGYLAFIFVAAENVQHLAVATLNW